MVGARSAVHAGRRWSVAPAAGDRLSPVGRSEPVRSQREGPASACAWVSKSAGSDTSSSCRSSEQSASAVFMSGGITYASPSLRAWAALALAAQRQGSRQDKRKQDVRGVTRHLSVGMADRAGHLHGSHAAVAVPMPVSRASNPCSRHGCPHRLLHLAPAENLSAEISVGVEERGGQFHLVIHGGDVLGGYADFNHLEVLGRLENAVPNLRRLNDAIARLQDERRPLILVHQPDPTVVAEDQLKAHRVVVDHIRHGPGVRDANVRRDNAAAEPAGNQIPIPACPRGRSPKGRCPSGAARRMHAASEASSVADWRQRSECAHHWGPSVPARRLQRLRDRGTTAAARPARRSRRAPGEFAGRVPTGRRQTDRQQGRSCPTADPGLLYRRSNPLQGPLMAGKPRLLVQFSGSCLMLPTHCTHFGTRAQVAGASRGCQPYTAGHEKSVSA